MNNKTNHQQNGRPLTALEKWSYMIASQTVKILAPNGYRKQGNVYVVALRFLSQEQVNYCAKTTIGIFRQYHAQLEAKLTKELKAITAEHVALSGTCRWWKPNPVELRATHAKMMTMRMAIDILNANHPPTTQEEFREKTDIPDGKEVKFPEFPPEKPSHIQ